MRPLVCRLLPLAQVHASALAQVAQSQDLYRSQHLHIPAPLDIRSYIDRALAGKDAAKELPFAVVLCDAQQTVVGTSRFQFIQAGNKRAQIGSTWLAPAVQGSAVNACAKYLMLLHGFEAMGLQRIEFAVHPSNTASRQGLVKLGASYEGLLRNYQQLHGRSADMCIYSVIASEWASVAVKILQRIDSKASPASSEG